jgi:hypothetical protein
VSRGADVRARCGTLVRADHAGTCEPTAGRLARLAALVRLTRLARAGQPGQARCLLPFRTAAYNGRAAGA